MVTSAPSTPDIVAHPPYLRHMLPSSAPPDPRARWLALTGVRLLGIAGALLGVVLIARAHTTGPKAIGAGLVLAALYFMATVTGALTHRWRSGR